jgi:Skp family chaperone for outer membrane proteins
MNKRPTLVTIAIVAGAMISTCSQAFDLYAETDSNSLAPTTLAPANNSSTSKNSAKASKPANKQADIRTRRNVEKQKRQEAREERRDKFREERRERRREERQERYREKRNERHREERRDIRGKNQNSQNNNKAESPNKAAPNQKPATTPTSNSNTTK